ncbi:hypothetical protein Ciccas_003046 [Cichlidogyrus casuarinus]|uniref:VWFD domain-containing protein n=1 Tax=Cichlidogyrus casuarinus TaxID=1844966 RepID=A0ABD2QFH6_9PLAT
MVTQSLKGYKVVLAKVPILADLTAKIGKSISAEVALKQSLTNYIMNGEDSSTAICEFYKDNFETEEACCSGYTGIECTTRKLPICFEDAGGCSNGGRCAYPDVCECQEGFGGASCDELEEELKRDLSQKYCYLQDHCHGTKKDSFDLNLTSYDSCCQDSTGSWGSGNGVCLPCHVVTEAIIFQVHDLRKSTCAAYCNDQYRTFDGLSYTFPGDCTYTLASSKSQKLADGRVTSSWSIRISPRNCDKPSACRRDLLMEFGDKKIRFGEFGLFLTPQGESNWTSIDLPKVCGDVVTIPGSGIHVTARDGYVRFNCEGGALKIKSDGISVFLTQQGLTKLEGLCGNANGDFQDDLAQQSNAIGFGNWWKDDQCKSTSAQTASCPNGSRWSDCESSCIPTCANLYQVASKECTQEIQPRCTCPHGMVEHEGACILSTECPCRYQGKMYPAGSKIGVDCNTCTCRSASWTCTQLKCPAICHMFGPRVETFDGAGLEFLPGSCSYNLVEARLDLATNQPVTARFANLSIEVSLNKMVAMSNGLYPDNAGADMRLLAHVPKTLTFHSLDGHSIIQLQGNGLGKVVVMAQDKDITEHLPYHSDDGYFTVSRSTSMYHTVQVGGFLNAMFNGDQEIFIKLDPAMTGDLAGLCGKYDGLTENDLTGRHGELVEPAELIAQSYQTGLCAQKPQPIEKSKSQQNIGQEDMCAQALLLSDEFKACLDSQQVDLDDYVSLCRMDRLRAAEMSTDLSQSMCPSLLSAATKCAQAGEQYAVPISAVSNANGLLAACEFHLHSSYFSK